MPPKISIVHSFFQSKVELEPEILKDFSYMGNLYQLLNPTEALRFKADGSFCSADVFLELRQRFGGSLNLLKTESHKRPHHHESVVK